MHASLNQLMESSIQIAWEYSKGSGELGDPVEAGRSLAENVETGIRRGEFGRLVLSNRAIAAYLKHHDNVYLFPN